MNKKIEFYFDFGSPTAYLADGELKKLAKKHNAELVYEPMLLGAVHKATENMSPVMVPAKGKYMLMQDLPRFVKRYDAEFVMNTHFPINTISLMRGCYAAKELDCFDQYVQVVFKTMWAKGLNLGDMDVFAKELNDNGLDGAKIIGLTGEDSIKEALKENTGIAIERGCFGAPTTFIGDEMFFGQDRMDFIEEALQA